MSEFDVVELHRMIHDIVKDAWFILFLADKPAVDVVSYFGQFSGEGDDTCEEIVFSEHDRQFLRCDHQWLDWYSLEGIGRWCPRCRTVIIKGKRVTYA